MGGSSSKESEDAKPKFRVTTHSSSVKSRDRTSSPSANSSIKTFSPKSKTSNKIPSSLKKKKSGTATPSSNVETSLSANPSVTVSSSSSKSSGDVLSTNFHHLKADVGGQTISRQKGPKETAFVCISIDFGTTYSGFAYSFHKVSNKIFGLHRKTPTVVLLDPEKNPVAFGEEARFKYLELLKSKEHKDWYLFEHFKMALFARGMSLDKDVTVKDILGREMKAIDVFTHAIKFIKTEAMNTVNDRNIIENKNIDIVMATNIHWVLTVPAIWNDLSKKFMRDAATTAGIPDQLLTLALEPEAASLYCKENIGIDDLPAGHRYMVLDLGGGTADITIHEVNADGTISEVHQPTGGDFGGTNVDNEFINMLVQLFGAQVFQNFRRNNTDEYLDLMHAFERKKWSFSGNKKILLNIPLTLIQMYLDDVGDSLDSTIHKTPFAQNLILRGTKLTISIEFAKQLFDVVVVKIVEATNELLTTVQGVDQIFLVGGFASSPYLQSVMKTNLANSIVIPEDPSMAVLHGAILYGKKPLVITSRVCKYTYGIARMMKFKQHHPLRKRRTIDGVDYCDDLFNKHIEIRTRVNITDADKAIAHEYFPTLSDMTQAVLEVYASPDKNPIFVDDDGCQLVGLIKLDINPQGDIFSKFLVKMMFGGTELRIEIMDVKHNIVTISSVDFVG